MLISCRNFQPSDIVHTICPSASSWHCRTLYRCFAGPWEAVFLVGIPSLKPIAREMQCCKTPLPPAAFSANSFLTMSFP